MSIGVIAFLTAIGSATWIYNKMMRQTGGLPGRALTVAVGSGLLIFVALLVILNMVLPKNG